MIAKDVLITRLAQYLESKFAEIAAGKPILQLAKPIASRIIINSVGKTDNILSLLVDADGKIDVKGILSDYVDNVLDGPTMNLPINGSTIGEGKISIELPLNCGKLIFNKTDIEDLQTFLLK